MDKVKKWSKRGGLFLVLAAVYAVCYVIGWLGGSFIQKHWS